jgi:hypothetical protein
MAALGGVSETASETPLSAGSTPSSAASRHDVPDNQGDDDNGRRNCDHGDCGGGHDHPAIVSLLPPRETLSRDRCGSRSGESLRQPREHRQVGVEPDAHHASDAKRCESGLMLEPSELALDSRTATIEIAEPLAASRDERVAARLDHVNHAGNSAAIA